MQPGQPSRTALAAAGHRAAHQVLEGGMIFADPLAVPILGEHAEAAIREAIAEPSRRRLRLFIAARSRLAEEALAAAHVEGVRQLVILGAGLDTYACRGALRGQLRIFEVDHPATQAWKRERLAEAGIRTPSTLAFAPVDFERGTLAGGLAAAGFDPAQPAFFNWLGVVPYLRESSVFAVLAYIAGLPGGARVFFDYANPPASLPDEARAAHEALAARVAAAGEAFRCFFDTAALHARLQALGFRRIDDLGPAQIAARFFPHRAAAAADRGGHVLLTASTI